MPNRILTALYEYLDEFQKPRLCNCRIGGFSTRDRAIAAILKKSPTKSGEIRIGITTVIVVRDGITLPHSLI